MPFETDWAARARREATVILAEAWQYPMPPLAYDRLLTLVATGWIQGANYGAHEGLAAMAQGFDELRADLT